MSEQKLILISFLLMAIRSWIHSPTGHLRTFWTGNHVINGTSTHNICSKVSILHINLTIDIIECAGRNLGFQGPPWNLITIIEAKLREREWGWGCDWLPAPHFFFVLWRMLLDNEKCSNSTFPLVCRNIPGSDLPWTSFFIMIAMIQVIVEWYMDQHPHI